MKNSILVVVLFVASMIQFSCSKQEVTPNLTAKDISGNYQITYLAVNKVSYEMPYNADGIRLSGILNFSVSKYPQLPIGTVRIMLFLDGAVQADNIVNLDMEDITPNTCTLSENGNKVGKYYKIGSVEVIEFTEVDETGNRIVVKSQK